MLPESVEALVLEPYCLLGRYDSESFRRQISHGPHSGTWWEGETHQHTKVEKSQQTWCKIRRDWLKSQMSKSCIAVAWVSILLGRFTMGSQLIKYMLLSYGRIRARGIRFLSQIFQLLTTYPSNSGYVCHRWRLHSSVGHRTSPRPKARLPFHFCGPQYSPSQSKYIPSGSPLVPLFIPCNSFALLSPSSQTLSSERV